VADTGCYVDIVGTRAETNGDARAVGYRADIDALPATDRKDVPYRSTETCAAHLCGHDAHTAVGLGVALVLHGRRREVPGTVRVFFQPNEEGMPSGAPRMIDAGVLDGLSAAYAIHVDPSLEVGRYGMKTGAITASADRFDVVVRQDGSGHSARPHNGLDTVWLAHQILSQFYQLAGRLTDARNATVLTVCKMAGSDAHNVIPAEASFGGTLRTTSADDRAFLHRQMQAVVDRMAEAYGAEVVFDLGQGAPPVLNDPAIIRHLEGCVREFFGHDAVHHVPRSSMGAEDFAHYLKHVPGALVRVGTASSPATRYPLHHHLFDLDESVLAPTARLMADALIGHLRHGVTLPPAARPQRGA
jgi:amidohydrolase